MTARPELPTLAAVVREQLGEDCSWSAARDLVRSGRVMVAGERETDPSVRVQPEAVTVDREAPRMRAGVLDDEAIVFADRHVVVVAKPAGVLSVPYAPDDRDTLVDQLRAALRRRTKVAKGAKRYDPEVGVVHRLDKGTSGLLVFTRTFAAKRHLSQQFRAHTVERTYLALCHGVPSVGVRDTTLIGNRGDGLRGSLGVFRPERGRRPPEARRAITHIDAVVPIGGAIPMSLVAVRLETGRQHQIRIHLAEAGHPLVGENVYIRDFTASDPSRRVVDAPRPMLHAAELGFVHPADESRVHHVLPPPADFLEFLPGTGRAQRDLWHSLVAVRTRRPRDPSADEPSRPTNRMAGRSRTAEEPSRPTNRTVGRARKGASDEPSRPPRQSSGRTRKDASDEPSRPTKRTARKGASDKSRPPKRRR